ncbi:MAG: hypothetical protein Q8O33_03355, partial [Pseudomonadota bacterium]|nr:hypothetical protein [Pseudomonadota bacterium]
CGVNKSVENAIRATTRVFGNGRLNPHGCGGLRAKNGIFGGELSNPGDLIRQPDLHIKPLWHQVRNATQSPAEATPFEGRRWRAGLPEKARIEAAITELAKRTGVSQDKVLAHTEALTSRGMLVDIRPSELAERWSQSLGVAEQEMVLFLIEADYLL